MTTKARSLYTYYLRQSLLPTYGGFRSSADLDNYQRSRHDFFLQKLHLPPRMFDGAQVVEFGPDSGENSLVFARWGASLTLVEPNPRSWPRIREYFRRFKLAKSLKALVRDDIESFRSRTRADVVDAEGFIYTVRPESVWIRQFGRILKPDGLAVISYYEASGALMELLLKAVHARVKAATGRGAVEAAWDLYGPKWDSIPHVRRFESWVMDVLENPFVRLRYFFHAGDLCRTMSRSGFDLYSSWPQYADPLGVYWHKKVLPTDEALANHLDFIARSCLSYLFARRLFLPGPAAPAAARAVRRAVAGIDALIDGATPALLRRVGGALDQMEKVVRGLGRDRREPLEVLACIRAILARMDDPRSLVKFCTSDRTFIRTWGMPTHFGAFRKRS